MDTEKPIPESVFARGWRDTKRIFHSVGFWAVEVIGGGLLAGLANWWVALIFVVGMVLALYVARTACAPVKLRQERIQRLETRLSPETIRVTVEEPPTVKRIAGKDGKRLVTFARVAVQSEDKSSTEIALRLLVEGWDESFLVSWGPSSLWHRRGPENLPKIMTLEPGEKKIGQLQFRIPFDEAVESELHCRLIVLKVRAEEEVAVYALDHPERTPAERERIEITIEPGEHGSILLTPCISDSRTGTHLAASLDGVKVINNDRDATVVESMWLQIDGVQPIAKLRIGNTNPSIPGRDYRVFDTLKAEQFFDESISRKDGPERLSLCVQVVGSMPVCRKLPKEVFQLEGADP